MRNKNRYSDKERRLVFLVSAELEDNDFVKYTTSKGNTLTTQYTNQLPLGESISVFITYDYKYEKWRIL